MKRLAIVASLAIFTGLLAGTAFGALAKLLMVLQP